jgi:beta-glucanase (GH16 family)
VWEDNFDVAGAPDANNWTYDLGDGGWGNEEVQNYTNNANNVIVEDGMLKITAIKEAGDNYTSARIKSENLFEFTYGRVEVRAKLPASQGTWPAIWMLGANFDTVGWPTCGEIDIMEQKGQDKNTVLGTVHHPGVSPGAGDSATTALPTSTSEFHNYTVEWTDTTITFLVDGFVFHTVDNNVTLPFNGDFFLILNVAMGGTLGGDIDPTFTQDTMEIDYVRVYQ